MSGTAAHHFPTSSKLNGAFSTCNLITHKIAPRIYHRTFIKIPNLKSYRSTFEEDSRAPPAEFPFMPKLRPTPTPSRAIPAPQNHPADPTPTNRRTHTTRPRRPMAKYSRGPAIYKIPRHGITSFPRTHNTYISDASARDHHPRAYSLIHAHTYAHAYRDAVFLGEVDAAAAAGAACRGQ